MKREMIRLSRPQIPYSALESLNDVLESGMLVQSKFVRLFEQQLEDYLDIDHCVLVSNGTAALHLSLLAAGIGKGHEVIIPAYTYTAVANAVELTGATPVFADILLTDCCIDTSAIESLIRPATRAIIAVHEFGLMARLDIIHKLAEKHHLLLIEDSACALGAALHGVKAGTTGFTGCFSFHPRKILTTGEGGAIVTQNGDVANLLRQMRNHGIDNTSGKIDFVLPGFNYRITDFQAALGPAQLAVLDEVIEEHIRQADFYRQQLSGIIGIHLPAPIEGSHATYQTFHLIFDEVQNRNKVKDTLFQEGIESNIGAYAIPYLTYYQKKYSISSDTCPNALAAFQRGLAIPLGIHLKNDDLMLIAGIIQKVMNDETA